MPVVLPVGAFLVSVFLVGVFFVVGFLVVAFFVVALDGDVFLVVVLSGDFFLLIVGFFLVGFFVLNDFPVDDLPEFDRPDDDLPFFFFLSASLIIAGVPVSPGAVVHARPGLSAHMAACAVTGVTIVESNKQPSKMLNVNRTVRQVSKLDMGIALFLP